MAGYEAPLDSGGSTITVGATVKLVGTVLAINGFDNRFNDIQIQINHPISASSSNPAMMTVNETGGDAVIPGYRLVLNFPPGVLTVGS